MTRFGVPAAALLAVGAQFLLSFRGRGVLRGIVPGVALYGLALGLLLAALIARPRSERRAWAITPGLEMALVAAIVLGGLYLRLHRIDLIPWGLNNDEAINALEAKAIAGGRPFSTMTEQGVNRETMFHYLVALSFRHPQAGLDRLRAMPAVFGLQRRLVDDPMTGLIFPLRFVSILVGTLTILLLYALARRHFGPRVALLAALFLAVSPWHVLYSRVGLRAILAPPFAVATVALFLRARDSGRWIDHLGWGLVLGLGFWTYTSFRAVAVALVAFVALTLVFDRDRPERGRAVSGRLLLGGGLAALIGVGLILMSHMSVGDFLFRGAYAALPERASWPLNLFHSLTMLNYFPARYAVIQSNAFISDGVSTVFGAIGLEPESIIVAALATLGLVCVARRAIVRPRDPAASLVVLCWGAVILTVGFTGPSLTRMLINVPWLCLFAALFAWRVFDAIAGLRRPVTLWVAAAAMAAIASLACLQGYSNYFLQAGRKEPAMRYFWPRQTVMGMFVRFLGPPEFPPDPVVYVMHSYGRETLKYLIADRPDVHLVTDPATIDLKAAARGPRSMVLVAEYSEYSRPFAEPLASLINNFGWEGLKPFGDRRFDPDKEIFFTYTLWKDAAGKLMRPPKAPSGGGFPLPPG